MPSSFRIGVNLGFSYTSCTTWSQETGYEAHRFGAKLASSGRYVRTSVFCQATSTLDGVPLLRAEEGLSTLQNLLPSLMEMSHSPLEDAREDCAIHTTGHRQHRSEGGSNGEPHAFLWSLFQDDDPSSDSSSSITLRVERSTMEASVFFVWMLRHIVDRIVANQYLTHRSEGAPSTTSRCIEVERIVLSLPCCAFYGCPYKVDGVAVALDAAASHVEELFRGTVRFAGIRIVPDVLCIVASQAAAFGLPTTSHLAAGGVPTIDEDRVLLACHVGGVSCSFSVVKLPKDPSTDPFVVYGSVADLSGAGGDAIDHAILHHILAHFQDAYIETPLSAEAKLLLLERIRKAKEECVTNRTPVEVRLLCGPVMADPTASYKLSLDLIEGIATDALFRKFTKVLQQTAACALQTDGCPAGVGSYDQDERKKYIEGLPIQAMRLLRPAVVVTSGRGLFVASLKKRVESLCRTLGATVGSGGAAPVAFFHEHQEPSIEGMRSYGALVLEEWASSPIHGLAQTTQRASHRAALGMLIQPSDATVPTSTGEEQKRLRWDVLVKTHGDSWGMLAPHGTPLPLYRTRRFDVLNRTSESAAANSARFSHGSVGSALHAELEICGNSTLPGDELHPLCQMDVWLPKLPASEGGGERFSITLDLRISRDGELEVSVAHEASGTVLHKKCAQGTVELVV